MIGFAWRRGRFWEETPEGTEVSLADLKAGQVARIISLRGPTEVVHRLQEMGLRSGTVIRVFRQGNPCIVWLGGSKLGVRTDDHVQVLVETLGGPPGHPHRHRWRHGGEVAEHPVVGGESPESSGQETAETLASREGSGPS